jgi:biotin transport system substrate-specific component
MRIQDIAYIALFAALTAVLGLIPRIDLGIVPVPITAQTLGPMLAGSILGARRGAASQALFLLLLAVGLPLLAGGRGGLGVFAAPSAGFVLAWPLAAALIGFATERLWTGLSFLRSLAINVAGGILAIYAIGIPVLAIIGGVSLTQAAAGSAVFIPGDLLKAVLAASAALFVKRGYPIIESRQPDAAEPR